MISVPLATLFGQCICSGIFPSKLKCAKVIPIFKGEDDTLPKTTDLFHCSLFITGFLKNLCIPDLPSDCNILCDQQYGFRSKQSTQHAILDIVNTSLQNMDNGKFSCGVFIDLKKAFDTVNHEILLA